MRDKEKRKEWTKNYYNVNKEKIKAKNKIRGKANGWYESSRNQEERKVSKSKNFAKRYEADKTAYLEKNSLARHKLKQMVIEKLGGSCKCCGVFGIEFLTIDHINGNGGVHRKTLRESGKDASQTIYRLIRGSILDDIEKSYRVLCWNCNMSSHYGKGICVHKRS